MLVLLTMKLEPLLLIYSMSIFQQMLLVSYSVNPGSLQLVGKWVMLPIHANALVVES